MQGKFWKMHDLLYLQRAKWIRVADFRNEFSESARSLQLDVERFNKDYGSDEVANRLEADHERSAALGLNAHQSSTSMAGRRTLRATWRKGSATISKRPWAESTER
jgi:hypothetical protein